MDWTPDTGTALPAGAAVAMQQHPAYAAALAAMGRPTRRLILGDPGAPVASALVMERRWPGLGRFRLLARGPVWAPDLPGRARRAHMRALRDRLCRGAAGVIATPDLIDGADPLADAGWLMTVTPHTVAEWALDPDDAGRRAGLHQKWRNRLVRAEGAGIVVRERRMPPDPLHWIYRRDRELAARRRYAALPPAFGAAWAATGDARLYTAERAGERVAAALVLIWPPGASYHVAWSSEFGRGVDAPRLVLWHAAARLAAEGVRVFDLGAVETEAGAGLARFKLGTGALAVPMGATWMRAPGTGAVAWLQRMAERRGGRMVAEGASRT